ncbi:TadE/TadG family type IV pilus assembly protein [Actinobacillus equuli]|uniref:TadE/TadG family type IV pilus assembly protein n=1 Tax=Actinobacillus equuli TaxID=718 RepID=UPI002443497A|nr:pilus assembly protein [Actinobacillus equuli]WGE53545.1 pilus assembly protein [Actinobacillus equuli subsp. haemolyticus]WGE73981.1 pilus assembly protein [Actinobacillus equuli subsp. haemolyticus]
MKITSFNQIKRFVQDESGVYAVIGGLLALPVVALMFVSLESAGIIQDKARLSDSLEQAVLSLSAENNSGRKTNDYKLSNTDAENGKFNADSEIGKRDFEIAKSFVTTYMPQTDASKIKLTPICKTTDKNNKQGHTASTETICTVAGTIEHKSWFPLKVGSTEVIPTEVNIASNSKAIKKNTISIPIDLMVVADLSGSMRYDLENKKEVNDRTSKLGILKDVLTDLTKESLFNKSSNPNNRIAVSPFALGAEYSRNECVLPFVFTKNYKTVSYMNAYNQYNRYYRHKYQETKQTDKIVKEYLTIPNHPESQLYRALFTESLVAQIDIAQTLSSIGTQKDIGFKFPKNKYCLGTQNRNEHRWFTQKEQPQFSSFVYKLEAVGSTFAGSGLLTAANKMLKENSRSSELGEETKRVLLVLSDGNDELSSDDSGIPFTNYSRLTEDLIFGYQEKILSIPKKQSPFYDTYYLNKQKVREFAGYADIFLEDQRTQLSTNLQMCNIIRDKLNKLNSDKNTSIVFVEFGYQSRSADAWKHCVGEGNYYSAKDKESLLNSFKQAIGHTDDVGHSIN